MGFYADIAQQGSTDMRRTITIFHSSEACLGKKSLFLKQTNNVNWVFVANWVIAANWLFCC